MATNGSLLRPRIGLTTYRENARWGPWDASAALLNATYIDSVDAAGGVPLLLPPPGVAGAGADGENERARGAVAGIDGLVVAGGPDVDPALYGAAPHPAAGEPQVSRDGWELAVAQAALAEHLPVLFVCRGAQLLNVARGGTLEQHVPDRTGHELHQPAPGRFSSVRVKVRAGSLLAGIVGEEPEVRCSHHQAIDEVGHDLEVVATAADGTIEAVEARDRSFALGVQWHPEEEDRPVLFAALVAAASAGTERKGVAS